MDLLDYRYVLTESDAQIRRLERRWQDGDRTVLLPLISAYYRVGNTQGLLEVLPNVGVDELEMSGIVNADLLRLRKLGIAARQIDTSKVDVLNGESIVRYIIQNVKGLPKPDPKSRTAMVEILEPFLPLLAQDAQTAFGSANAFKFVWEEIENPEVAEMARLEMSKSPSIALKYFGLFQRIVQRYDRRYWPWRFGDPSAESVLNDFAQNPTSAIEFAEIAAKLDPTKEPWPSNTGVGQKALAVLFRSKEFRDRYLNLPQGSHALNNSKIRALAERGQSQNYN